MKELFYYKTVDDVFVFTDGRRLSGPDASLYLRRKQRSGVRVERLYPDVADHWDTLKKVFPSDYWEGKSPEDVYLDE